MSGRRESRKKTLCWVGSLGQSLNVGDSGFIGDEFSGGATSCGRRARPGEGGKALTGRLLDAPAGGDGAVPLLLFEPSPR